MFVIHLSGEDLPPQISFLYEKTEDGIEISRIFTYYVEKTQMEMAGQVSQRPQSTPSQQSPATQV